MVVSKSFYFHPYLGKIPILTNIFQMGWNHQLDKTCCFFPSIDFTNDVAFLVSQVSFTLQSSRCCNPHFSSRDMDLPKIQGLLPLTLNLEFISFSKMVLDRVVQKSHETSLPFENFALKPCPRSYWVCSRFRYIYIFVSYQFISSIHA